jgi:hypothetical protein
MCKGLHFILLKFILIKYCWYKILEGLLFYFIQDIVDSLSFDLSN